MHINKRGKGSKMEISFGFRKVHGYSGSRRGSSRCLPVANGDAFDILYGSGLPPNREKYKVFQAVLHSWRCCSRSQRPPWKNCRLRWSCVGRGGIELEAYAIGSHHLQPFGLDLLMQSMQTATIPENTTLEEAKVRLMSVHLLTENAGSAVCDSSLLAYLLTSKSVLGRREDRGLSEGPCFANSLGSGVANVTHQHICVVW